MPGVEWVRAHYLYPETLTDALVDVISGHDKVLPYIDMPLQHASDAMLRAMRRGHGGDRMIKVGERLRGAIPDMVFRTTFIVGHPGETDEDFEELRSFVEWAEFDHVGVFLYSAEEGTHSATLGEPVEEEVKKARHEALMETQRPICRERLDLRVGT